MRKPTPRELGVGGKEISGRRRWVEGEGGGGEGRARGGKKG